MEEGQTQAATKTLTEVQVEKKGAYLRQVSVTVPPGEVEATFDEVFKKFAKSASLPGFRPGKVPRGLIEKRFALQAQSEVQERLVDKTFFDALMKNDVIAVARPNVTFGSLQRGDAFSYTAMVEVRPDITLVQVKGLGAPVIDVSVAASEVDEELEEMRQEAVQLVPVLTRDVAQKGDVVQVDYVGTMGGVEFEGGSAQNALIELGGKGYIPGFAEQLEGARVPGERTIAVDFPEDYSVKDLAGKGATFKITLKELKSKELPALDDAFAADVGEESLQALRDRVTADIEKRKKSEAEATRRRVIMKELIAANPVELPPSLVEQQAKRLVQDAAQRLNQMMRQRVQLTEADLSYLASDSWPEAEKQVAGALLLMEVAKAEALKVEDDEVDKHIETILAEAGEQAERMRQYFSEPQQRDEISYRMLEDKVIEFLLAHSVDKPLEEVDSDDKEHADAHENATSSNEG